jgi:mannan endo-1,4-beta-mannosidase
VSRARDENHVGSVPRAIAAAILGAIGCLGHGAMQAKSAGSEGRPSAAQSEGPVEEADQPSASFVLDGEPFCFAGTNNYYLIYKSHTMVDDVLETTKRLGLKVIRIWAYLDRGSLDGTVRNVDGAGEKGGVYFQYWDPVRGRPAYNDGATGLEHLDYVLDKAKALDLKVMLVLTNNWKDFGGMDQYLVWYGVKEHHRFYTDSSVRKAYESWIDHLVHRKNTINGLVYRDDPTIFAWELANEPRCINAGEFDHPSTCNPGIVVRWADETSTFIRSIDTNHLVSVGDEGFFADGRSPHYDGADGVDHSALLALRHIDFGTYHLYPESWGHPLSWASTWIEDHIEAARAAGKPTLLEEYGVEASRSPAGTISDDTTRRRAYARWHEMVGKRGGNGALFWMLSGIDDDADARAGMYPDYDHFAVYTTDAAAELVKMFASNMATDGQACKLYRRLVPPGTIPKSPFVTVSRPPAGNRNRAVRLPPPLT